MPFDSLLRPELVRLLSANGIVEPTDPQRDAIPKIKAGKNVLVVAPTGIGKTESAILPIFDSLLGYSDPLGIRCLYITPLRALNRDMERRMLSFGTELGISVGVRHGDTSPSERQRQSKAPPQIMITTPETLQVLFTGKNLREHLKKIKWVIIDEIHELVGNERGAQLAVALERLVQFAGDFQRIGLSATVGNLKEVTEYLKGSEKREVLLCKHDSFRDFSIKVERPTPTNDSVLLDKLQSNSELLSVMVRAKEHIESVKSTLFFVNTRETAEWLASRYHMWDENYPIGVHHGSLSKEMRMETEDQFKSQQLKSLICTSSLELGIDIGSADLVIQYNSPRQVARMTQRAGRAGHRIGGKIRSVIIATAPDELLESMVVARRCEERQMEWSSGRENPLAVLANQLVAMTMAGPVDIDQAFETVKRSYPFRTLERKTFDATVEQLKSIRLLLDYDGALKRSKKGMDYFYQNISMIPDEKTYLVRDIGSRAVIGTLDESFVATFEGEEMLFIAKGRTWRVVEIREDEILVEEARNIGNVPSWQGSDIPVPFEIAMEVGKLRRTRAFDRYPGDPEAVKEVVAYLDDQEEKWKLPSDKTITLEIGDRVIIINCCFGSRVNNTLSKILSALLMARLGESVGVETDAYRIILEMPRNIDRRIVVDTFKSIKPGTVEAYCRLTVLNSTYLKWRFMYVAKKFGIIEKGADRRYINYKKLFEIHKDSPAYNDAVNIVLYEDLDIPNTELALKYINEGKIEIVEQGTSKIGLEGITRSKELMQPARADHAILVAMKKRLGNEVLFTSCLSCKNQRRLRVEDAPKKFKCPMCGGFMLALLKEYERDTIKDFRTPKSTPLQDKKISKNADLVNSYGNLAALVLAGRGIGPEIAARILGRMHVDEDELLRDIMNAEVNYAKTKQFWD
ncbi:MAG: DEAD/DEAH box helicase [archaeon]|nr:DEAD/DEAH box helicase [archaeon]